MYERKNIIQAIDLVYHSVLNFNFLGRHVKKGWLECTIVGDTKCGKSETAETIVKHYRAGEFVTSTEHSTEAGILGGLTQMHNGRWLMRWGKIVINHKRIVLLDESDKLSGKDGVIGKLSGVRSSGIAEIVKIQSQKAMAKTRIIFISNPLRGTMSEHNYGVDVIREIFRTQQDMSRIDFAIGVAEEEVDLKLINKRHTEIYQHKYTSDVCHHGVMFAWSRNEDQIIFEKDTEDFILEKSIQMGNDFSSDIPLVIAAEMRIKLARMAVALATRLYSTDDTGENVIVKKIHVMVVIDFLYKSYSSDVMGYKEFSDQRKRENTIGNTDRMDDILEDNLEMINMFLDSGKLTLGDIEDITGFDRKETKELIVYMRKERLIKRKYTFYVKTPSFIRYLKIKKRTFKPRPKTFEEI